MLSSLDTEKINYELATSVLEWVATKGMDGAILVFMPGVAPAVYVVINDEVLSVRRMRAPATMRQSPAAQAPVQV
jgi:hypothetical protein